MNELLLISGIAGGTLTVSIIAGSILTTRAHRRMIQSENDRRWIRARALLEAEEREYLMVELDDDGVIRRVEDQKSYGSVSFGPLGSRSEAVNRETLG